MKKTHRWFKGCSIAAAVLLGCAGLAYSSSKKGGGGGGGQRMEFSGRAVVVDATVLGTRTIIGDTGDLPASGGALETSLLEINQPGLLTGNVVHGTTIGQGDRSRTEASVADVNLTVGGHTVTAGILRSRAEAVCGPNGATTSGSSELVNLGIDGQTYTVGTEPNQTIGLPDGTTIIINEQTSSSDGNYAATTVNALHVIVPNPLGGDQPLAEVIIASSHADIRCGSGNCQGKDFVTGGGWILTPSQARGTFGVGGGIKDRGFWGHLTYIDHGINMKVKGTSVTNYLITGPTSRQIHGTAEINGVPGTYIVDVADNGEPGRADTFFIKLSNGYTAGSTLPAGNIQLHRPCK
jgi:hypothetical protein